jgi:rhomboid protease GluP
VRRDPLNELDPGTPVEVYSSPDARACKERALVLRARGLPFQRLQRPGLHVIAVEARYFETAQAELASYESENRDWPPREELPPPVPGAWTGTAVALALMILVFLLQRGDALGLDWIGAGGADSSAMRSGQIWRAVTALTLHSGLVHLLSNLLFGALIGFLVCYTHGGGLGWLAILLAGVLGNLGNALLQGPGHLSVGASTAVFGAVGILCGSEWRRRHLLRQRRLRRAAPIVIAVLLLGLYGTPMELPTRTDMGAHVTGLVAGLALGTTLPGLLARGAQRFSAQVSFGAAALAILLVSWILAITNQS